MRLLTWHWWIGATAAISFTAGYASPQPLKDMFGGGHYGTVKAHVDRWRAFVK